MLTTISSALVIRKPPVPILGGRIAPLDLDETVSLLLEMVRLKRQSYVCIANVHTTTLALRDNQLKNALDGAALVVADGMPLVWRIRAAGYPEAGRVYGADVLMQLLVCYAFVLIFDDVVRMVWGRCAQPGSEQACGMVFSEASMESRKRWLLD